MAFYSMVQYVATATGGNGLDRLGSIFTQFMDWMSTIVSTMTTAGNEIMLLPIGIFVIGAAIGLAGRLIGR